MTLSVIEGMVLDAISNDYEEIGEIVKDVKRFGTQENVPVSEGQIITALRHLVTLRLATAFVPNHNRKLEAADVVEWDNLGVYRFKVSASGKALVLEMEGD